MIETLNSNFGRLNSSDSDRYFNGQGQSHPQFFLADARLRRVGRFEFHYICEQWAGNVG
jgi:hypothetical protein